VRACSKYLALCEQRSEYEALVQDSSRLLNRRRGGFSLREEELLRARVTKELPKTVAYLQGTVPGERELNNRDIDAHHPL